VLRVMRERKLDASAPQPALASGLGTH